jgi:hypothetical protein
MLVCICSTGQLPWRACRARRRPYLVWRSALAAANANQINPAQRRSERLSSRHLPKLSLVQLDARRSTLNR